MGFARRIIELMLLRSGPQNMPGHQAALAGSAAAYCILLFLQVSLIAPGGQAVLQAVLATVLLAVYASSVLRMRGLSNRFAQTATSLFATGATLTLVMLAPTHAMAPYLEAISRATDPQSVELPPGFVMLAYVVLGVWGLAIYSHIYRHALDGSIWLGVGAALAFEVVLLVVFSVIG